MVKHAGGSITLCGGLHRGEAADGRMNGAKYRSKPRKNLLEAVRHWWSFTFQHGQQHTNIVNSIQTQVLLRICGKKLYSSLLLVAPNSNWLSVNYFCKAGRLFIAHARPWKLVLKMVTLTSIWVSNKMTDAVLLADLGSAALSSFAEL